MSKETIMMKAIMSRYKGLVPMKSALSEDWDTTICNLLDDMNNKVSEEELEKYIYKVIG